MRWTLAFVLAFARPSTDSWFGADKAKHFAAAALVQSVAYAAFHDRARSRRSALWRASAITAAVSLGKEGYDKSRHRDFSVRDLTWDAAGAGVASVAIIQGSAK